MPECVKIFEATFLKGTEIHGGPLFLFHFPGSPSFFYLLFVPPTGGLSLCWHRGLQSICKFAADIYWLHVVVSFRY